jgi:RNA polymerase sigma-70 factor (ECF subfamily)
MNKGISTGLLARAQDGDEKALGVLLQEFRPLLVILAARQLEPGMSARLSGSDIAQQTILEAIRDFRDFRGQSADEFTGWLKQILRHNLDEVTQRHIVPQKRTVRREEPRPSETLQQCHFEQIASRCSSPSGRAMQGEQAIELAKYMAELPEDQFEAIRLRHIEGWSLRQMAEQLGRSDAAVAGLIKRGLESLRNRWCKPNTG